MRLNAAIFAMILVSAPAYAGWLQDAGGAASDATKHAGAVISDAAKSVGGATSEVLHGMSQSNWDAVQVVLGDAEDAIHSFGSFFDDADGGLRAMAKHNAERYHNVNPGGQKADCTAVVAAACAYEGSSIGGALGAAIGAGSGVALADWACSAWYP